MKNTISTLIAQRHKERNYLPKSVSLVRMSLYFENTKAIEHEQRKIEKQKRYYAGLDKENNSQK